MIQRRNAEHTLENKVEADAKLFHVPLDRVDFLCECILALGFLDETIMNVHEQFSRALRSFTDAFASIAAIYRSIMK